MQFEWRASTIGREVDLLLGFAFKSAAFADEPPGHRLLRGDNVKRGFIEWGEKARYWPLWNSDLHRYLLRSGDVVVGMDGSRLGENFAVIGSSDLPALLVQRVACLRAKEGLHQEFLRYLICNPLFTRYIKGVQTGTSIPHMSGRQIADFEVLVPPLNQQVAIASMLHAVDDRIDLLRQTNATLEFLAQAVFKSWFIDFDPVRARAEGREPEGMDSATAALFPAEFEASALGPIPKGWGVSRLGDVIELAYGKALKATDRRPGCVPVYGSGGVTGYHDEALVDRASVIVGRKGTVGALYWEDRPFFPIDTTFYVKPKIAPLTFCFYAMQQLGLERMNTDAAVPGLNRENAYRLPLVRPSREGLNKSTHLA